MNALEEAFYVLCFLKFDGMEYGKLLKLKLSALPDMVCKNPMSEVGLFLELN
jgi:hypothetical protein